MTTVVGSVILAYWVLNLTIGKLDSIYFSERVELCLALHDDMLLHVAEFAWSI